MRSVRALLDGPRPVTAPLLLNPLMAKLAEAAGVSAGYLGGTWLAAGDWPGWG